MATLKPPDDPVKADKISDFKDLFAYTKPVLELKPKSFPLPTLKHGKFSKHFVLDVSNIEVTSVDIAAHGGYILVGCSNGMIILFSTTIFDHRGLLVGHIHAKGLHTNLLLTVKITEDCRFCFGGVTTGSSEILAIDMGRLPVESGFYGSKIQEQNQVDPELITIYSHFDPKLRGFGNAARVSYPKGSSESSNGVYRLICGRARLLHIWQFSPESTQKWTCMFDVATNGNTIECIEFRNGGHEVMTKSVGANLRVWNLHEYEIDQSARPSYEDIPNSADVKSLLGDFAFGGMYNFAVVKIGAPKEANRDAFEMPERSTQDDNGQRRKRMMRQIDEVIGTNDARHALVLCTDGGVMYFQNNGVDENPPCLLEFSTLQRDPELERAWSLRRVGRDGDVVLLRALKVNGPSSVSTGNLGGAAYTSISVYKLSDAAPEEVKSTALASSDLTSWSDWGYYHDCSPAPYRMGRKESDPQNPSAGTVFAATSYALCSEQNEGSDSTVKKDAVIYVEPVNSTLAAPPSALQKPPLGPSGMKKIGLSVPKNSDNWQKSTPGRPPLTKTMPGSALSVKLTHSKTHSHPSVTKERTGENGEYVTPALAHTTLVRVQPTISPEDAIQRLISSKTAYSSSPHTELSLKKGVKRMRAVTSSEISSVVCGVPEARLAHLVPLPPSLSATVAVTASTSATSVSVSPDDHESVLDRKKNRILPYSAPPTIPHIVESTIIQPKDVVSSPSLKLLQEYEALRCAWVEACRLLSSCEVLDRVSGRHTVHPARSSSSSSEPQAFSLGMAAMQCLGTICLEQDRMREMIMTEICGVLGDTVSRAADRLNGVQSDGRHSTKTIRGVVSSFRHLSSSQLLRQQLELRGAIAQDEIHRTSSRVCNTSSQRVIFRYEEVFTTAIMFEGLVDKMITDSEPEYGIPQGMKTLLHAITESVGDVEENRANTVKV